jgi:uncharacterized membrane protein
MDAEIAILRLFHILPGAIWVGSAVFLAFVVQPALAKTGPPHAPALMANMLKPLLIILHGSAILTIVFGVIMAFRLPGRDPLFDYLWSTDWGTMIWLGFLFSVVAYGIGNIAGLSNKKMADIGASLTGPPTPEQAAQMTKLRDRAILLARIGALLVVVAVAFMALANHV